MSSVSLQFRIYFSEDFSDLEHEMFLNASFFLLHRPHYFFFFSLIVNPFCCLILRWENKAEKTKTEVLCLVCTHVSPTVTLLPNITPNITSKSAFCLSSQTSFRAHTCLNKLNICMCRWMENYTHGELFSYIAPAQQRAEKPLSEVNLLTLVTITFC